MQHLLKPVLEPRYEIIRADQIGEPGLINDQILEHLQTDELAIADLTDHNANVFYELAVRHLLDKPCVHLIERSEKLPFDVSGFRAIRYALDDVSFFEKCKQEFRKHVESVEREPEKARNPISSALDLSALKSSEDPIASTLEELSSGQRYLQQMFEELMRDHALNNAAMRDLFGILSDPKSRLETLRKIDEQRRHDKLEDRRTQEELRRMEEEHDGSLDEEEDY
jgi:hypothetical protein